MSADAGNVNRGVYVHAWGGVSDTITVYSAHLYDNDTTGIVACFVHQASRDPEAGVLAVEMHFRITTFSENPFADEVCTNARTARGPVA